MDETKETATAELGDYQSNDVYVRHLRPCMENVLVAKSVHDPEHKLKVSAVAELLLEGASRQECIDFFKGMEGFSQSVTEHQIDYIIRAGYRPFKCSTILKLGGCLKEKCYVYNSKGGKLE
jgi:DNA primase large subunit